MMTKTSTCSDQLFKRQNFEREIIILCVRERHVGCDRFRFAHFARS